MVQKEVTSRVGTRKTFSSSTHTDLSGLILNISGTLRDTDMGESSYDIPLTNLIDDKHTNIALQDDFDIDASKLIVEFELNTKLAEEIGIGDDSIIIVAKAFDNNSACAQARTVTYELEKNSSGMSLKLVLSMDLYFSRRGVRNADISFDFLCKQDDKIKDAAWVSLKKFSSFVVKITNKQDFATFNHQWAPEENFEPNNKLLDIDFGDNLDADVSQLTVVLNEKFKEQIQSNHSRSMDFIETEFLTQVILLEEFSYTNNYDKKTIGAIAKSLIKKNNIEESYQNFARKAKEKFNSPMYGLCSVLSEGSIKGFFK